MIVGSNSFTYIIKEGVKNVFKNKKATFISLVTMICAMFLFGAFFAIGENVNAVLEQVQQNQGMEVFIENEATDEQISELETQIKELDGINTVTFKSKQEALDSMKENLKDNQDLLEGYEGENNIFPASFIVTLTDLSLATEIEAKVESMENVKKITSNNDTINTLMRIANGIKIAIGAISIILLIISTTIISNTIRLTVHARRKEISIMKYVGATNRFIRWPFMIEGIIIGIIAAGITILVVGSIYDLVIKNITASNVLQTMGVTLLQFSEIVQLIAIDTQCGADISNIASVQFIIFDAPTSSFGGFKEDTFYNVIDTIEKQCLIVTKDLLNIDKKTGEKELDFDTINKLSCAVYRIEKVQPFNDKDLSTIQTVIKRIK